MRLAASLLLPVLVLSACAASPQRDTEGPDARPAAQAPRTPHVHDHGKHRFDDTARWARIFDDPARDAWQRPDEVVSLMALEPGMTVVDLGAGTGYFLSRLSAAVGRGGSVLALDVEPSMVRHLLDRATREGLANVAARQVAQDDPGLTTASVDRVLIVDTWHHLPSRVAYGRRLAEALRSGGSVVVVDFTLESELGPPRSARLSAEQVVAELASAGMDARIVPEDLPEQYVVVATRPPVR